MTPSPATPPPSVFYKPEDPVFPAVSDDDLWRSVHALLLDAYGQDRVLQEHARQAFEGVCADLNDSLLFRDFFRKVRLRWLWQRPPLPRGMV